MSTPEQIQRDIEGTRRALSTDVDRLTEKVSPGRVVGRRVDRVKSGASSIREKVMGSMPDPQQVKSGAGGAADSARGAVGSAASGVSDAASSVTSTIGDAASSVGEAVAGAPQAVRRQAQGNPLGAGLVAFGVGLIVSSLVPATEREKQVATQAQDMAVGPLQDKAKEMAGELQGSAQESVQQVKEVASNAASQTADEARSAAEDVKAPLQQ